jgi:acetyl esterase/lipase
MHPEIAPIATTLPTLDLEDVAAARAFMAELTGQAERARPEGLSVVDRTLRAADGSGIGVRVYRREDLARPPALVFFHGGAFSTGDLDTEDAVCVRYALEAGCAVVSVDYRLAPEHPYPAGLDDCFAALGAVAEQADELDLDRERLAVGGGSTGAGLAAAVALLARDRGGPALTLQLLVMPVLDDGLDTPSLRAGTDAPMLDSAGLAAMWRLYLGTDTTDVEPYAAPARATDLAGLPQAYVMVAGMDPARDGGIGYARRLMEAGVEVELHVVPGVPHAFDVLPLRVAERARDEYVSAVRRALGTA